MFKRITNIITVIILSLFIISMSSLAAVKYEDRGSDVKQVQKLLDRLGYDIGSDGIFGYQTKEIVKDFQLNNGLKVDGVVGKKTLNKLKERAKEEKYTVKSGDTLSEIALNFNTSVSAIEERNNLKSEKIIIGQELIIPNTGIGGGEAKRLHANIIHEVQAGDALSLLAKKYGTDVQTIKLANNLTNNRIYIGQTLVIPHLSGSTNRPFKLTKGAIIWPVLGRITSSFGARVDPINGSREYHEGLDIAVPFRTEIRAAAAGTVIQSGWISGFGKTVVIDHGQGVKTLYGHNAKLLVRAGSKVNVGQVITLSGSTGRSTGPHLHFGLLLNGKPINPLRYLP